MSRERRPGRRPVRNSILLGSFDHLEPRQLLNGAVGVQSRFVAAGETHNVMIRSIDQDPDNDGRIPSTAVTFRGRIAGPRAADFTDTHAGLSVQVLEGSTVIGSTTTFTPVAGQAGRVDFVVNATLLNGNPTPQALTFSISRDGYGTLPILRVDNGQPLTATMVTDTVGPTVVDVVDVASPRDTAVNSVNVVFSEPIDVSSFGFNDLTLTRTVAGVTTAVPLDNRVSTSTVSTSPTPTYLITGLTDFTGTAGTYELTVVATGINDVLGNAGSGSLSTTFVFDPTLNLPPAPPAPTLQAGNDTGFNGSDGITRAVAPVFVAGGVPGDASVQLLRDGSVVVGTRTGPGPIADPSAPEGRHLYTVRQVFANQVLGRESAPLPVVIDRTAPTTVAAIDPTQLTFSGDFPTATSDRRPRVVLTLNDSPAVPGNILFAALTAIDGNALATPVAASPAVPGEQRTLTVPTDLLPGVHALTIRTEDAAGNVLNQVVQVLVLAGPSLGAPGTPVFNTTYDLKTLESLLPFGGPERPWSMAFDRTTQTLWAVIQGADTNPSNKGGNRLLQVDPATGLFKFYNFQEFDPNSGPHGIAFDFESHLTPRVWFTQRSNHLLSYLDLATNEVVSYDLGHLIRDHGFPDAEGDIHAVVVDRRGDVWVTDESDSLLLQLHFEDPEAGIASRMGTMVIHQIPAQPAIDGFKSLMGESVAGPHGIEVVVDDNTGEAFVYFTTLGNGRFNLLRTGYPGVGNVDQWTSWDLQLPKYKNGFVGAPLFATIDTNETPGNPYDDRIYFGDPGFPTSGFPGSDVIRELQPGSYLLNPTSTTSPIRTWHIPKVDGITSTVLDANGKPVAAPNQTYVDREGTLYFIDRTSGVGRLDTSVTQLSSGFGTADAYVNARVDAVNRTSIGPIDIHPSRILNADLLNPVTLQPTATYGDTPDDRSNMAGLDQYLVTGGKAGGAGQGQGPFRGTISAGNIVYGSLITNDLISSTVFAETARREMSVVVGPGGARMAFQVLRNGHLVVTSRGPGEVVDHQDDLTRSAADPLFQGDVSAVIDGFGVVHAIGRDARGGSPNTGTTRRPASGRLARSFWDRWPWPRTRRPSRTRFEASAPWPPILADT